MQYLEIFALSKHPQPPSFWEDIFVITAQLPSLKITTIKRPISKQFHGQLQERQPPPYAPAGVATLVLWKFETIFAYIHPTVSIDIFRCWQLDEIGFFPSLMNENLNLSRKVCIFFTYNHCESPFIFFVWWREEIILTSLKLKRATLINSGICIVRQWKQDNVYISKLNSWAQ